ncbi:glucose-6-phosphate isomerase [Clostridium sp. MCC353]|uniref:glucose-6-phosphate isomerase n=1 Tax=Clostridium sp. MCC353 TaxID=2592646 RepID=UPI001C023E39|nr:glucose-6-phosphate isomerase [Clostridium sp. MCC353]MBT9775996.1 glucose-6-phosphate isomerase [Clostridium sp. MCC353]
MNVRINTENAKSFINQDALEDNVKKGSEIVKLLYEVEDQENVLGWLHAETAAVQLELIKEKAKEVRENADVFVIVGVGGSNQAARAMIEALSDRKGPEVVYLGNSLSPHYISQMMKRLEGRSVYINVIAKNFETLEPGSHFRILRQFMNSRYSKEEMAKRVILTGTTGSRLEEIAVENGYTFLQFPIAIGGRYSAFSPVGLFPVAAAGLDVDEFLNGVKAAEMMCMNHPDQNPAVEYAAVRNLLYRQGFDIEMLVSFEPQFAFFNKWWIQLFGESEGKEKKGIFPSGAIYSEDLHSMGQYMQDGRRNLIETFLTVKDPKASVVLEADRAFGDRFDYLDGMDFKEINNAAETATIDAHVAGGVPCIQFLIDEIAEETFGELYYYFMMSCAVSGKLMEVNPFDQEGVEEYKRSMFKALGKN